MAKVKINLKDQHHRGYDILIKNNIDKDLIAFLKKRKIGSKYAIISDSKVAKLFGEKLSRTLNSSGLKAELITFPPGEKSKSASELINLAEKMLQKGFNRSDAIIALGGGVTGDLGGFLASSFMRGIPYIQIPTTLLAMVDSSVGGKTGIDLPSGKNLIGAFHQPSSVFIGIDYIKNLPQKQVKNGLAEIIKYGVIKDKKLFEYIKKNLEKILNNNEAALTKIITASVKIKEKIVEKDEHDKGERIILNYGHTFGHAIEKKSGYKLLHGFAIS
ncbi:3-dehydroquinate synthase, partial [Candidatus Peregrinibacteria bacterium]|nr:3-dehydroquinate synthase [Candidatus Peregrinibacteria bacterium]